MTLSESFDNPLKVTTLDVPDSSVNLNSLYCSHLWTNNHLRNKILTAPSKDNNVITYCYTCKGKIRKYELKSPRSFTPHNHSTPTKESIEDNETLDKSVQEYPNNNDISQASCPYNRRGSENSVSIEAGNNQHIPSISQQIDSSFRHKYVSYERNSSDIRRQRRLRKNLRGFGCVVNFTSTDSLLKKSTQIQACSISVMIIAIVIISFILVNFTNSNFKGMTKKISTTVVPTNIVKSNETTSAITNIYADTPTVTEIKITEEYLISTELPSTQVDESSSTIISIISKIRKNIKTYPKKSNKKTDSEKPKDVNNRDLSQRFCSCQKNEICMLDENSGTSICRKSIDNDDPTGCGGLCALETEACHLVDKARGVRVCRLLALVSCTPDEWRCRNGLCVPTEARCDGSIQCYDRSDEMLCECDLTKQFRCGQSISCFPHSKLCDGVIDCWDGYDEVNCTSECPNEQFTCTDGQCILASRFCDGLADCADRSDEPDGCGGSCGAHEMSCRNHRCVPHTVRCDGHDNCGDSTDELHCTQ